MDFGGDFDDDLFGETKEKGHVTTPLSYNAKICPRGWFHKAEAEGSERANILKFRADEYFYRKEYVEAMDYYNKLLEDPPAVNNPVWRDLQESRSRCYIHLGDESAALDLASQLHEHSLNFEQKTTSMRLLADVTGAFNRTEEELRWVQSLATLHSANPDIWITLARIYRRLGDLESGSISPAANVTRDEGISQRNGFVSPSCDQLVRDQKDVTYDNCGSNPDNVDRDLFLHIEHNLSLSNTEQGTQEKESLGVTSSVAKETGRGKSNGTLTTGMDFQLAASACLARARLLLQRVQNTISSFAKDKNYRQVEQLTQEIEACGLSRNKVEIVIKNMGPDLYKSDPEEEKVSDEVIAVKTDREKLDKLAELTRERFEEKWFSWS